VRDCFRRCHGIERDRFITCLAGRFTRPRGRGRSRARASSLDDLVRPRKQRRRNRQPHCDPLFVTGKYNVCRDGKRASAFPAHRRECPLQLVGTPLLPGGRSPNRAAGATKHASKTLKEDLSITKRHGRGYKSQNEGHIDVTAQPSTATCRGRSFQRHHRSEAFVASSRSCSEIQMHRVGVSCVCAPVQSQP